MIKGVDAAYPPTLEQAVTAFSQGYRWCGFYPMGKDGDEDPLNTWSLSDMETLVKGGLHAVPIFVPSPGLSSDPIDAANEWFACCKTYNLSVGISILYDGPHLSSSGAIKGPVWLPIPGYSGGVGPQSAIQNGQANILGWSVDTSIAADDFPMGNGIVVDFEHNAPPSQSAGIAWYQAFQQRITQLATYLPTINLPARAGKVRSKRMFIADDGHAQYFVTTDSNGNLVKCAIGPITDPAKNEVNAVATVIGDAGTIPGLLSGIPNGAPIFQKG